MIEVLEFCNKFAANAFEIYIIVRLLKQLFEDKLYDKRFLLLAIMINMIGMLMVDYLISYVWINLITCILLIFILTCCYRASMRKKIVVTLGIWGLLALGEMIIAGLIGVGSLGIMEKAENEQSIAQFLSCILFWIMAVIIQRLIIKKEMTKYSIKVVVLEIIVFSTLICELLILCIGTKKNVAIESAILLSSEVTVYLIIYLKDCLIELFDSREQTNLIEKEKEYYMREAALIQEKQDLERQFRHDWKNRIQVLQGIAEQENVRLLHDYVSEIENKVNEYQIYSNTGNLLIDSIINSKLDNARKKEIEIEASVMLPANFFINKDDIIVILGNLLDNAIEACERLNGFKTISFLMKYEGGCILINIKNSFDEVIRTSEEDFATRKEDKELHGIGLKSVRNTIEKYNGILEILAEENLFSVDVMMYL
ncbi:MAG: GHKL domain-containing protein [Roseburia sp.]|nr:GHKL domain-containing protein [Roseburia sp.]MCM1279434.1 GHKL domain-containing protein [Robinsoniella sp.]